MSVKQDRTYARTAQDIERKYSFGKTFADMLGLINENRDKVDSVESTLRKEIEYSAETTLKRTEEEIVAQAKTEIKEELGESISGVDEKVTELSKSVELKLDADAVNIEIEKALAEGVDRVETKTGYRFDDEGLNISKSGSEMANLLDNTGMYVKRGEDEVLTANNKGVSAVNLHAKTYLIIGSGNGRCRFEDYGVDSVGCFWVGG